jgi:hypothetical protein
MAEQHGPWLGQSVRALGQLPTNATGHSATPQPRHHARYPIGLPWLADQWRRVQRVDCGATLLPVRDRPAGPAERNGTPRRAGGRTEGVRARPCLCPCPVVLPPRWFVRCLEWKPTKRPAVPRQWKVGRPHPLPMEMVRCRSSSTYARGAEQVLLLLKILVCMIVIMQGFGGRAKRVLGVSFPDSGTEIIMAWGGLDYSTRLWCLPACQ